jgi:hypothetical protein
LRETGAVADYIVLLFLLKVVFVAARSHFLVFLTAVFAVFVSQVVSLARLQLAAHFLLRSFEIFLRGWFLAAS